jgi:hypothetical protein
MGKWLIIAGLLLVAAGLFVLALQRLGLPFGHLPGDLTFRSRRITVFAPLGTCLLLSILLTLALYVFGHFRR